MAQLDASIPLQVRQAKIITPDEAAARGLQMRSLVRSEQEANRATQERQTIRDLYRQNTGENGQLDAGAFDRGLATSGLGDQLPGIQAERAKVAGAQTTTQAAQFKLAKEKMEALSGGLSALLANPNVTHADAIAKLNELADNGVITPEQGAAAARGLPGQPERLRPFLMQQLVTATDGAKRAELLIPKYDEQDRGGVINQGTIDPLTGQRVAGADVAKTATPGELLTNDRAKTAAARSASLGFGTAEGDLLAALAEQGVSLPAGMRSKDQQIATLKSLISRNPNKSPDQIAYMVGTGQIGFGVDKKETTTAAAQSGKIRYAENEIKQIAPLIREVSALVPRGQFVPWNKLVQMGEGSISDPNLKQLKSYMNTLSNAYDMLAARGGTDMEKRAHNRAMFDTADSPEALEAALQAVETEASLSDKAATLSTMRRGAPPASAAPSQGKPLTPEQAAQLPSGTPFIGMDGIARVKH